MEPRPLRADARRNREKVLQAAVEEFETAGIGVPLDDIARRAGVGAGTVYRHFPTKEALFEAVVDARVSGLVTEAQALREGPLSPGESFFTFLARLAEEATFKRTVTDALTGPAPVAVELRGRMHEALEDLLSDAQATGEARAGLTGADVVLLLKGLLHALQESDDADARARVLDVVVAGLRAD